MNKRRKTVLLVLALLTLFAFPSIGGQETVFVQKEGITVRSGPGNYYPSVGTATKDERYTVLETSGKWMRIRLSEETSGWIPDYAVGEKKAGFSLGSSVSQAVGSKEASTATPTAAAKGFNSDVEKKYSRERGLDFSPVDAMEAYTISPDEMEKFLSEGGLEK
jgi:uncharacterized protein YgiM (DUF1202 family)